MKKKTNEEKIEEVIKKLDRPENDYYSIEWPHISQQFMFGSYIHEILEYYQPWLEKKKKKKK